MWVLWRRLTVQRLPEQLLRLPAAVNLDHQVGSLQEGCNRGRVEPVHQPSPELVAVALHDRAFPSAELVAERALAELRRDIGLGREQLNAEREWLSRHSPTGEIGNAATVRRVVSDP